MQFSPHHTTQRSDPTPARLSDSLPRPAKKDHSQTVRLIFEEINLFKFVEWRY